MIEQDASFEIMKAHSEIAKTHFGYRKLLHFNFDKELKKNNLNHLVGISEEVNRILGESAYIIKINQHVEVDEFYSWKNKFVIVLDSSLSMEKYFDGGEIQNIIDKIAISSLILNKKVDIDLWAYSDKCIQLNNVDLSNLSSVIDSSRLTTDVFNYDIVPGLGIKNNEIEMFNSISERYSESGDKVCVILVTDTPMEMSEHTAEIKKSVEKGKRRVFWQVIQISENPEKGVYQ